MFRCCIAVAVFLPVLRLSRAWQATQLAELVLMVMAVIVLVAMLMAVLVVAGAAGRVWLHAADRQRQQQFQAEGILAIHVVPADSAPV